MPGCWTLIGYQFARDDHDRPVLRRTVSPMDKAGEGAAGLAILIDHDDAEREYAYKSRAATFDETEPITTIADRLGWTKVSMTNDWKTVFPPSPSP